jgi:hypothetical protein
MGSRRPAEAAAHRARPVIAVRLAGPADAAVLAEMRYAFRSEMAVPTEPETQFLERATRWLADRHFAPRPSRCLHGEPKRHDRLCR